MTGTESLAEVVITLSYYCPKLTFKIFVANFDWNTQEISKSQAYKSKSKMAVLSKASEQKVKAVRTQCATCQQILSMRQVASAIFTVLL